MATSIISALATDIAVWFPELGGRSIAVSEVEPFNDKTNVPTLPIAVTALVNEQGEQSENGGGNLTIFSDIVVQFVYAVEKYKRQDGAATPFFAFYDYESVRDRFLSFAYQWRTPKNGALSYRGLDIESDEFAVYITMRFRSKEVWAYCPPETDCPDTLKEPFKVHIVSRLCRPVCEPCCDPKEVTDPCAFAP